MGSLLVHVTHGPEAPTRAALACLVAKTARDEGHEVSMFFAGDAVSLLREEVTANLAGLGTGALSEHLGTLLGDDGVEIFASGMSAKARGVSDAAEAAGVTLAMPTKLVELTFASDRVLTY